MPRWQKLLRHDALIHCYKEAVRNAMAYACPRLTGECASDDRAPAGMEPLEPRLLLSGTVEGTVFTDTDGDGVLDAGDIRYAGAEVFIDVDGNGEWDPNQEPGDTTDINGDYLFDVNHGVAHTIMAVDPSTDEGWLVTAPSGGEYTLQVADGQISSGHDFAVATASTSGPATAIEDWIDNYTLTLESSGLDTPTWDINWGDGTTSHDVTGASVSHRYSDGPDTHTITATATDGVDNSLVVQASSITVEILDRDPLVILGGVILPPGGWLFEGDEIVYQLLFLDYGEDPTEQIHVVWGDGESQTFSGAEITVEPDGYTYLIPHTYHNSGNFTPVFTVTTEGSNPISESGSISIANAA